MDGLLTILQSTHPDVDFETHTALIEDGILDSFDLQNIMADIYDTFDVAIPAEEIVPENFNSYTAIVSLVKRLADD